MNTLDLVESALYLDAVAAAATAKAKAVRETLAVQARAEYEQRGAAPTWRTASGTVSLAISQPTFVVEDRQAFMNWVAQHHPFEVEEITRVRPAYETQILRILAAGGEDPVVDGDLIVEGVRYVPGGQPRGVSIRGTDKAKADNALLADVFLSGGEA
jgi:hypothetical protein